MLLSEIREQLKKYNEEDLRLLVAEMYKSIPKRVREDKDIDTLVQDVRAYISIGKIDKTKDSKKSINELKQEIEIFIDYAYKQYYFAPNNFVHKKERPKWRFKVKAYIKELQEAPIHSAEGKIATTLLQNIYKMLSYACAYYIFNTDNPFRSVGIEQTLLLNIVIARTLGNGANNESLKSAIELVINSAVDRETLHSSLITILVMNLRTSDSRVIAIEQCKLIKKELEKPKPVSSKKTWGSDSYDYEQKEKINNLVEMVFRIYMELCEYDEAIRYFNKNYYNRVLEVSLYVLLRLLHEYELKEHWLREYDMGVKKGLEIREKLRKTYEYIQKNDKLPEYSW